MCPIRPKETFIIEWVGEDIARVLALLGVSAGAGIAKLILVRPPSQTRRSQKYLLPACQPHAQHIHQQGHLHWYKHSPPASNFVYF